MAHTAHDRQQNGRQQSRLPATTAPSAAGAPVETRENASVPELARGFTTELIRWRGNMQPEAIVSEAFALARAFVVEANKEPAGAGKRE